MEEPNEVSIPDSNKDCQCGGCKRRNKLRERRLNAFIRSEMERIKNNPPPPFTEMESLSQQPAVDIPGTE